MSHRAKSWLSLAVPAALITLLACFVLSYGTSSFAQSGGSSGSSSSSSGDCNSSGDEPCDNSSDDDDDDDGNQCSLEMKAEDVVGCVGGFGVSASVTRKSPEGEDHKASTTNTSERHRWSLSGGEHVDAEGQTLSSGDGLSVSFFSWTAGVVTARFSVTDLQCDHYDNPCSSMSANASCSITVVKIKELNPGHAINESIAAKDVFFASDNYDIATERKALSESVSVTVDGGIQKCMGWSPSASTDESPTYLTYSPDRPYTTENGKLAPGGATFTGKHHEGPSSSLSYYPISFSCSHPGENRGSSASLNVYIEGINISSSLRSDADEETKPVYLFLNNNFDRLYPSDDTSKVCDPDYQCPDWSIDWDNQNELIPVSLNVTGRDEESTISVAGSGINIYYRVSYTYEDENGDEQVYYYYETATDKTIKALRNDGIMDGNSASLLIEGKTVGQTDLVAKITTRDGFSATDKIKVSVFKVDVSNVTLSIPDEMEIFTDSCTLTPPYNGDDDDENGVVDSGDTSVPANKTDDDLIQIKVKVEGDLDSSASFSLTFSSPLKLWKSSKKGTSVASGTSFTAAELSSGIDLWVERATNVDTDVTIQLQTLDANGAVGKTPYGTYGEDTVRYSFPVCTSSSN